MSHAIDEAMSGYVRVRRALLAKNAERWRDLDLSLQQLKAMYFLSDEEEASIGRLAELFGVGMPAASVLADRLVRSGYALRREDPSDRRRALLTLTRTGNRVVADLREGSQAHLRRWMAALTPADQEALARGWQALAEVATGAVREKVGV
jgi:DNA-binding MarR family transcriptional regulator